MTCMQKDLEYNGLWHSQSIARLYPLLWLQVTFSSD